MSCSGSCEGDDDAVDQHHAPPIQGSDLNKEGVTYTSRISVKQVVAVIEGFTDYKKWLVEEIGFGGILKLHKYQKLNLRLSSWLMSKVDVHHRAVCITEKKVLRF